MVSASQPSRSRNVSAAFTIPSRLSLVVLAGGRGLPVPDVDSDRAAMGLRPSNGFFSTMEDIACPAVEDGD
jgi:hypothetical protein